MSDKFKGLDFGSCCTIEQKRYGVKNEFYQYKVIGVGESNYYRSVPVDARDSDKNIGDVVPVVRAICCGIDESKVETFRVEDVEVCNYSKLNKDYAIRA